MIKQRTVLLLSTLVLFISTSFAEVTTPSESVQIPTSSKTIDGFVPVGWSILDKTDYSDFNNDGKQDIAMVVLKDGTYTSDYDMDFNLLVLLGSDSGFKLDYNILSNIGKAPSRWYKNMGRERLSLGVTDRGNLYVYIKRSFDHNTSSSDYTYSFAYKDSKLLISGFKDDSMWFDYSSIREVQFESVSYDFLNNTKSTGSTNNTFVPACSRDASEVEQKSCPEPIETKEPLVLPSSFKFEITNFSRFSEDIF